MARGASGAMALSMQFLAQSRPAQVLVACVELQPRAATCRVRPWGVQEINWAQGHHSRMEAARQKNTAGTRSNSTPCSFHNAQLDGELFRGVQPPPMATVMAKLGGVRALVVGGCCELNTTAHELIVEIGSEMGAYNAAESGEDIRQCTALEVNRVRQRLAVQIWRDYQEHINARIRYADPDADARTRLAEEMEQEEEEAEQALVRLYNEAYLQRMGRPQEFGV